MLINDVETRVGLSKKSIRYYEEHGLIHPSRNNDNGYREYDEEDIEVLKKIKFLRELGVTIKELQQVLHKEYSLQACMEDRIAKISKEEKQYAKVKSLCSSIIDEHVDIDTIEIDSYFKSMNVLNKEGFSMKQIEEEHSKKIRSSIIAAVGFSIALIIGAIAFLFAYVYEDMPLGLFIIFEIIFIVPIIFVCVALSQRIKEIKRGEIDEASKY